MHPDHSQQIASYIPYAYRVAVAVGGSRDDDFLSAAHDALLAAIPRLDPFWTDEHKDRYVRVCVRNHVLAVLRDRRPHESLGERDFPAPQEDTSEEYLSCLSSRDRQLVRDNLIHGHTLREIAAHTNVPLKTLHRRLLRAKATIASSLR